jgi:hypothetical protein
MSNLCDGALRFSCVHENRDIYSRRFDGVNHKGKVVTEKKLLPRRTRRARSLQFYISKFFVTFVLFVVRNSFI